MNMKKQHTNITRRIRVLAYGAIGTVFAAAGASLSAGAAEEIPPQRMTIAQAFEPVVVDGLSNDRVWERGALTYGFLRSDDGEPARHGTRARAIYDRTHLYFAFTAMEAAVDDVLADARRGGNDRRAHDTVGVRLAVPSGEGEYREVEIRVNPANRAWVMVDGRERRGGLDGLRTGVFERERSWDAEIAIPFAALGVDEPRVGDVWGIDFLRHRAQRGDAAAESTAWNPPGGKGELRFGRDLIVYLYSQRPFTGRDEVMVYNPSDQLRQLRAEMIDATTGKVVAHETIYLGSGHRRQHYPLPAPDVGDYYLIVRQTDRPLESDDDKLVEWRPHRSGRR